MQTHKLQTGIELKADDDEAGTFKGHGAIFGNIDGGGDIIAPGAFTKSLKAAARAKRLPRFLLNHDPRTVAGVFTDMSEDSKGLAVVGQFNLEKQIAREAFSDVKLGAIDGLSIGYIPIKAARDENTGVRTIKEADVMEVSLVAFPMNERARIGSVKSIADQIRSVREFEDYLRDGGFSAAAAKSIASGGFKGSRVEHRDGAAPDLNEIAAAFQSLATTATLRS